MLDPMTWQYCTEFNAADGCPVQQVNSQLGLSMDGPKDCYMACLVEEIW